MWWTWSLYGLVEDEEVVVDVYVLGLDGYAVSRGDIYSVDDIWFLMGACFCAF